MSVSAPAGSAEPLVPGHDLLLLDLDGVVYVGEHPVPGAAPALSKVRSVGSAVEFVTNNASRRPPQVVEILRRHGVAAEPDEVATSAQASAAVLAERWPAGSPVLVVGTEALADEVAAAGLRPTRSADDRPVAVVQGFGREVGWADLAEGMLAIDAGAEWVLTNPDSTIPSPRGRVLGNGALAAALAAALERRPDLVVGKPAPELFQRSARRRGARRPLVVGDRLDTDIEGAVRAGMPAMLVLTGVTTPAELLAAPAACRPSYLADDLSGLLAPHPEVTVTGTRAECDGWTVAGDGASAVLSGAGEPIDALRAVSGLAWSTDRVPALRAESEAAERALTALRLG